MEWSAMDAEFLASLKELYRRADAAVEEAVRMRTTRLGRRQSKVVRDTSLIGPTHCHACGAPLAVAL
jgi:hypothetical protein